MIGGDWQNRGHADAENPGSLTALVDRTVPTLIVFLGVGLLLLDYSMFWIVFVVGFPALYPSARAFAKWYDSNETGRGDTVSENDDRALETLRDRYARGEIDEAEFERRVQKLLQTESPDEQSREAESTFRAEHGGESSRRQRTRPTRDSKN